MRSKLAHRQDANQAEIVQALRSVGATVFDTSAVGRGFPDIVVGFKGHNFFMEIKSGDKAKLTDAESDFIAYWWGTVNIVRTPNEALQTIGIGV